MEMKETLLKFGGDVKNSAGRLAKGAIDGSKKMAEKMKIKRSISQAESKLNAAYMEIGKKYEELFADCPEEEFVQLLEDITEAKAKIAEGKAELAAVDSCTICEGCGKNVQEDQKFCPYCGLKKKVEDTVVVDEAPAEEAEAETASKEDSPVDEAAEETTAEKTPSEETADEE